MRGVQYLFFGWEWVEVSKYSGVAPNVTIEVDSSLLVNLLKDFLIFLHLNGILRIMLFQYDLQME